MSSAETDHPLRKWRTTKGLTQQALGEAIGVFPSQISMVESGKRGMSIVAAAKLVRMSEGQIPLESLCPPLEPAE